MKFFLNVTCSVLLAMTVEAQAQDSVDDSGTADATEQAAAIENTPVDADIAEPAAEAAEENAEAGADSILNQPLDGSSVETFQAGLDRVEQEASEEEYRQLMSSISFLLFYDLGAKRDKATLYSRLNGKSPQQIIERVQSHRAGK